MKTQSSVRLARFPAARRSILSIALLVSLYLFLAASPSAWADVEVQFTPNTGSPPLMGGSVYNVTGSPSGTEAISATLTGADPVIAPSGTVTVSLVGGTTAGSNTLTHAWADRGALTGGGAGFTEGPLYESFAGYNLIAGTYEWLTISGLKPSTLYVLQLYAYDNSSSGNVTFTDTTTGSLAGSATVNFTNHYSFTTDADADAKFSGQMSVRSDVSGNVIIKGTGVDNGQAIAILNGFRLSTQPWVRIKNAWTGKYLSEVGGKVIYETPGWSDQTSQWALLAIGNGQCRIQNRYTGHYMNNQDQLGWVECSTGSLVWASEKWVISLESSYFYRIENLWKGTFMNVQDLLGYAECTSVPAGFTSSWWSFETVHGATVPWITYEAENGTTNGTVIGPGVTEGTAQAEASNRQAVTLNSTGQYVQVTSKAAANAIVVRLSIPDAPTGGGIDSTLNLYVNGTFAQTLNVTSRYSWVYGNYLNNTWSNDPAAGTARHLYDEVSALLTTSIPAGATVKLQKDAANTASYYTIDFIELEQAPAALTEPANYISITDAPYNADPTGATDSAAAISAAWTVARTSGKGLWIPRGTFQVSNGFYIYNIKMNGAGMWYSKLFYPNSATCGFNIGTNVQFSDFALIGAANDRGNGGTCFVGSFGTNTVLQNLWVEHFGFGMWVGNPNVTANGVVINNLRMRDLYGDGINLNTGTRNSTIKNTCVRNSGDDGIALFSAPYTSGSPDYNNTVTDCTVQSPWFANGIAVYGGYNNVVNNCEVYDTVTDFGLFIDQGFNSYAFAPTTTAQNIDLYRCGGTFTYWSTQAGAIGVDANTASFNAPINLWDIDVYNASYSGIQVQCENGYSQAGLVFDGINIKGAATYGINIKAGAAGSGTFDAVTIYSAASGAFINSAGTGYTVTKGAGNNW